MNERLKGILLLPFSRKVVVGLAAGALAYANKHLDLGLSDDVVKFLVGSACFVILGISIEDGAQRIGDAHVEAATRQVVNDNGNSKETT